MKDLYTNIPQNEFGNSRPDLFVPSSRIIALMSKLKACAQLSIFKLPVLEHIGQNLLVRLNIHDIRTVMIEVIAQTLIATSDDKTFLAMPAFKPYFRHLVEYAQLIDDPVVTSNVLELDKIMQAYLQNEYNENKSSS